MENPAKTNALNLARRLFSHPEFLALSYNEQLNQLDIVSKSPLSVSSGVTRQELIDVFNQSLGIQSSEPEIQSTSISIPVIQMIIMGPYAIEKLVSSNGGRTVYIFYDYHLTPKCPNNAVRVTEFFDQLLKEDRNFVIDVMLEMSLRYTISTKDSRPPLEDIRTLLKDCYSIDKSRCPYPNTRVHWVDVRFDGILKEYIDTLGIVQESMKTPPAVFKGLGIDIVDLNQKFFRVFRDIDAKFSVDRVLRDSKIIKQINNIADKSLQIRVLEEITNRIRWMHDKFSQLLARRNQTYFDMKIVRALLEFTGFFMDAYTVGRMLRDLGGSPMKNVIVYAGGAHSDNISKLLQKFDYRLDGAIGKENHDLMLVGDISDSMQCLDISSLLPLF